MTSIDSLNSQKYISLETYRKNKEAIRTPVWFVISDGLIFVVTRDQTGKIKRLRHTQKVRIASCTIKGKITGEWVNGTATILDEEKTKQAVKWRDKKYGFMAKIAKFLSKSKGDLISFSIKVD